MAGFDESVTITLQDGRRLFISPAFGLGQMAANISWADTGPTLSLIQAAGSERAGEAGRKMRALLQATEGIATTSYHNQRAVVDKIITHVKSGKLIAQPFPPGSPMAAIQQPIIMAQIAAAVKDMPNPKDLDMVNPNVSAMDKTERMMWAVLHCGTILETTGHKKVVEAFKKLLKPEVLIIVVAGLLVWAVSHYFGVGFLIDIAAIIVVGIAVIKAFNTMIKINDLVTNATKKEDLVKAADLMANVVIGLTVEVFLTICTRGAVKAHGKRGGGSKLESGGTGAGPAPKKKPKKTDDKPEPTTPPKSKVDKDLDAVYKKAPAAKKEIDDMADDLAKKYGGTVAKAPLKGRARAKEKVEKEYGGDVTELKDVARNTIIIHKENMSDVVKDLKDKGADVWEFTGDNNALGYSGINANIKTKNGMIGEIQVNTPQMIYAKESPEIARRLLGDDIYDDIAKKVGVEGGLGHKLYEQWRVMPDTDPQKPIIEEASRAYYNLFTTGGG